jgi:hypothetical protein
MTIQPPLWAPNTSVPAFSDRALIGALFRLGGVVSYGDLKVSQRAAGGPNFSVDVAVGIAIVDGTGITNQGHYVCWSDSVVNKVVNAAPGAGTSRIDRIVAQVFDTDAVGGGSSTWDIIYVAGTPGASPSPPAIPASALPLARITVLDTSTSVTDAMITNDRVPARVGGPGAGGIIRQQDLIVSESSAHSTSGLTDMVLNDVPVVIGHSYAIHLHSLGSLSADTGTWRLLLRLNGSDIGCLDVVRNPSVAAVSMLADGTVWWKAPATQATDDFTVYAELQSGSTNLQLTASSTLHRTLTVADHGILAIP